MVDARSGVLAGQSDQIGPKEDGQELAAWLEGELCQPLRRLCGAKLGLDLDLPEMVLTLDGKAARRSAAGGEAIAVDAGLHRARVGIGSRSSVEQGFALRLGGSEKLLARQQADGGIVLQVGRRQKAGGVMAASVRMEAGSRWTKPTGFSMAGLGAAAALVGAWQGSKSKGLVSDANTAFDRNGGAYRATDLTTLQSAKSAASTANALFVVGGLLAAAGLAIAFVF
jgi:hypothetical protein